MKKKYLRVNSKCWVRADEISRIEITPRTLCHNGGNGHAFCVTLYKKTMEAKESQWQIVNTGSTGKPFKTEASAISWVQRNIARGAL
ncbi:MAG: hypothetical protein GWN93_26855 [Deltaproteobacteria bacterium]|nr:hypothetical protein [Deltaproteobacteria bacterium]